MNVTVQNRQRRWRVDGAGGAALAMAVAGWLRLPAGELGLVVVGDRAMRALNRRFHGVDAATDVLAFGYSRQPFRGEIIVSVDHAVANARRFGVTPARELALYLIHGLLHLAGYRDATPAARARMRAAERRLLGRAQRRFDLPRLVG
jgi:probable rRNA maturation factor